MQKATERRCCRNKLLHLFRRWKIGVAVFTGILLSIAVVYDWKYYRIPNWLTGIGLGGSLFFHLFFYGSQGLRDFIVGAGICFLVMFPFSMLRMFGAGDVKLLMVVGSLYGISFTMEYLFVAFIIGAGISLCKMRKHQNLGFRLQYLANYFSFIWTKKKLIKYQEDTMQEKSSIHFAIPMGLAFLYMMARRLGGFV